ncbi:hypothetical protein G4Z16_00885 [Streptomyces bathyalis]|uniref:Uncharacterized protein n=1 Tax=Streptomyces bathyalis TaxID=2710756 RepID=A0A7T1T2I6_9ACTN|nr:hypothetical protein G4Z16_00885 [Streptomyces bathyalis]
MAREARARGGLEPFESWYDATGDLITLAYLDDEAATVLAMSGDLDGPGMYVIGHFSDSNEDEAGRTAPPPVPPGVLRPEVSRYDEHVHAPETTLQAFTQDVIEARHSGEVAEALLTATEASGSTRGPLPRLSEFVATCAEFSDALETRQGQQTAARLRMIATQINLLTQDLRTAGNVLDAAGGVLPPHRTPHPRHLPPAPGPTLNTQRPAAGIPATTPAPATTPRR